MYEFQKITIKNIQQETNDAVIWTLEIPDELKEKFVFKAGQHLTFKKDINGEEIRRSYSIFNPTDSRDLKILIKKVDGGRFSEAAQTDYQINQEIEVMPPTGHFSLIAQEDKIHVFFAAGSGITPILSMIYEVLYHSNGSVILYYGNSTVESTLLKDHLSDLKDKFPDRLSMSFFLSQEPVDVALFSGRIDREKVEKIYQTELSTIEVEGYYLCGPGGMIDVVKNYLLEQKIDPKIVHSEQFLSEGQVISDKQKTSKLDSGVMVTIDGVTSHYHIKQGQQSTLLDAALDSDINMPYSCKAGVCATCRCLLVEGEVEMLNNYSLEEWEIKKGYILTCQSVVKTKKIVINYDG